MALTDIELLTTCVIFTLDQNREAEQRTHKELETSARTALINALRLIEYERVILAVGTFSMFEALFQSKLEWDDPFKQLGDFLRTHDKHDLASAIDDYKLAVNVLKHGKGRSHQELLARADKLEFKVRAVGDYFYGEGDLSDIGTLINVDDKFVRRCVELVEQAFAAVRPSR